MCLGKIVGLGEEKEFCVVAMVSCALGKVTFRRDVTGGNLVPQTCFLELFFLLKYCFIQVFIPFSFIPSFLKFCFIHVFIPFSFIPSVPLVWRLQFCHRFLFFF